MNELLRVTDLGVRFGRSRSWAVSDVDLVIQPGERLGLIGESGSGKSVTALAIIGLLSDTAHVRGSIRWHDRELVGLADAEYSALRGSQLSMVFQEPMTALDPVFTIGRQIAEAVQRHEGASRAAADARALELLELVQIPSAKRRLAAYPHELSGGLRQRAMIAVALACKPKLLLADEPTTALDATVQIQVLLLLRELQEKLGMGVIFVTHDLGVAGEIADRVAVMYAGRVVEEAPIVPFMAGPLHPYAQGLLGATVHAGMRGKRLTTIPGAPPSLETEPVTCAFAPRCVLAQEDCLTGVPAPRAMGTGRMVRCVRSVTK